jgi:ring-1,2-phenylacetyl-CoA epoxidase subunit PaaE
VSPSSPSEPQSELDKAALLAAGALPASLVETFTVELHLHGAMCSVLVAEGTTVLDAGLSAGMPLRYSCTLGLCGTCMLQLRKGQVRMEEPNCLLPEERAEGKVLACIAHPVSAVVLEVP